MRKLLRAFLEMGKGYTDDRRLYARVLRFWAALLFGNRMHAAHESGAVSFLGYPFWYSKRGSLYSMFYEVFVEQNYHIQRTDRALRIFDCGANVGIATRYFLARAPKANITLFEPNPHTAALLRKNLAPYSERVTIHECGLGARAGQFELITDAADKASQSASLTGHLKAKKQYAVEGLMVAVEPLSRYIDGTLDVLKMDIEGVEVSVIRELKEAGKLHFIERIFIEYHYDGVYSTESLAQLLGDLESAGFAYIVHSPVIFPFISAGTPITHPISYKITAWQNR